MFQKSLLFTVLGAAFTTQIAAQNITAGDVIEIFAGVMNGIVHEDHLDYLLGCMSGTEGLVGDIENAVDDFSQGTFWSISAGIIDIKQFIDDIPQTITNCSGIPDDF